MNKIMIRAFFWAVFLFTAIYANASEIKNFLSEKSQFSPRQITEIDSLINLAVSEKLPEDYLSLRIREGIAKNVPFEILSEVIKEKTLTLRISRELLNSRFEAKYVNKEKIKLLAEYLDRGLTINSFNELTREAKYKNVNIDKTLDLFNSFVLLKEKSIERKYAAAVFVSLLEKDFSIKQINEAAELFIFAFTKKIEFDEAQEIILSGIKSGKSPSEIKGQFRKKILKEIKEEMKEYDKDKRLLEGTH